MWQKFLNLFKRKKVTIDSLVKNCKGNLASLSWEIGKAVLYRKEVGWTKPEISLERGYTDCSGYAYIWMKCLDKLGIKNHIYACLNDNTSKNHAIVVFKRAEDRGYSYTSNDEFYKTNITDKDELLKFAYPAERYEIVV